MSRDKYDMHSSFNLELHKKTFNGYLEVIIHPDGSIHYAVPSHQEYLIKYACNLYGITRDELNRRCPPEYYLDFMAWLCMVTNCVAVWSYGVVYHSINEAQKNTINVLRAYGVLYLR